jgi:hypothetical protein
MPTLTRALTSRLRGTLAAARTKPEPERTAQLFDVVDQLLVALEGYASVLQVAEGASAGGDRGLVVDPSGNVVLRGRTRITLDGGAGASISLEEGVVRISGRDVLIKDRGETTIKGSKLAEQSAPSGSTKLAMQNVRLGSTGQKIRGN